MPINKPIKLGVVMDPIEDIHFHKDSTLAILLEAKSRDYELFYMQQKDLFIDNGKSCARTQKLTVHDDENHWFDLTDENIIALDELDVILMRKDPPFDMEYIYTTYLLELAQAKGTLIVNNPQSLRDANEKVFTSWFPQCTTETLISRDATLLKDFIYKNQDTVLKPLHGMGGGSIFHVKNNDDNINVIIETLTNNQQNHIMAQKFIPEIKDGDKRIFLINGEAMPYALARIPQPGDIRGNLAAGGKGKVVKLSKRDYWICEQIAPVAIEKGLLFVGLDVIGDYLTEINVTSPTCIREVEAETDCNICAKILDSIEPLIIK